MNVVDAIVCALREENIGHLFCVPGEMIDQLLRSLTRQQQVQPVVCAHEEGAAYMADGYARAGGRFGVCATTSGPGFTNTLTALATAHTDRSPLLAISGEVKQDRAGRGAYQDSSATGIRSADMARSITALQRDLTSPSLIWHHLGCLLRSMLDHSSRGPVHLSIPFDVQEAEITGEWARLPSSLYQPRFVDTGSCDEFWEQIGTKAKVAVLAGSGCVQSDATEALVRFAESFDIPVATTLPAKGVFPEDHRLSLGVMGWPGNRPAIDALTSGNLDVLFVLGSRLNMLDTLIWTAGFRPRHALIANDINASGVFQDYPVDLPILGDARSCLDALNYAKPSLSARLRASREDRLDWLLSLKPDGRLTDPFRRSASGSRAVHPAEAITVLRRVMPRSTMLFIDSGAHAFFAAHYWTAYEPRRFFTSIRYMGSMGWAIPAAIGAKLARPNDPCVVVTGDGCMLMHGIEMQTAARYGVPLVCVVLNNSAHGNPKLRADRVSPELGRLHELPTHDWAKFAASLGAQGMTVHDASDLEDAFEQALQARTAVVIDVRTENIPTPTEAFDRMAAGGPPLQGS
ncbi:acetolactate synthase-1/2/3 large subunit [Trinickia symbiotica]|uniref:Thiamine pyrophosphate-binding protein n=1 Tax=Trinickia symbiotica TaxID=863227 RepID=A0A2N7X6E4_9BURK|nr:thiamine pyrophosphate-binding protein [Trinickia symbiotica]PMS37204.1 thiamine pyrophosphate-binding protein [Trinickia symbiotica]PPK42727.1 acetolactate synthase-1/2/3 large subunit [Trinickia symbiotica]